MPRHIMVRGQSAESASQADMGKFYVANALRIMLNDNIRFFARYLLLYASSLRRLDEATEGAVYDFLADWFPRKALWASVSSMKAYLASFKKFFQWMGATGLVSAATVTDVLSTLKDERALFLSRVAEEVPNEGAWPWQDESPVPPPSEPSD